MPYKRKAFCLVSATMAALLLMLCCSCSSADDNDIEPDSQAYAYLEVFISMVGDLEEAKEDRIKYIGIDATKIMHESPDEIKKLFEDYVKKHGISIRWDIKKDKCDYKFFKKGELIIFEDVDLAENKLETEATWMGAVALASANVTYVVEKEDGVWTITGCSLNWIS